MKNEKNRSLYTIGVFLLIYLASKYLFIREPTYDAYVESIRFLACVLGAGFYWIGSKE